MHPVDRLHPGTLDGQVGRDRLGQAEQHQRLVDQVRPEVVEDARPGDRHLLPAALGHGAEAVVAGHEAGHLADQAGLQAAPDGEEVAVPAPVLEHAQQPALGRGQPDTSFVGLGGGERERLVHHHVSPRPRRRPRPAGGARRWARAHHHQLDRRVRQQLLRRPTTRTPGEVAPHLRRPASHRPRCRPQARLGLDQRRIERRPAQPVPDQPDPDGSRPASGHDGTSGCWTPPAGRTPAGRRASRSRRRPSRRPPSPG